MERNNGRALLYGCTAAAVVLYALLFGFLAPAKDANFFAGCAFFTAAIMLVLICLHRPKGGEDNDSTALTFMRAMSLLYAIVVIFINVAFNILFPVSRALFLTLHLILIGIVFLSALIAFIACRAIKRKDR